MHTLLHLPMKILKLHLQHPLNNRHFMIILSAIVTPRLKDVYENHQGTTTDHISISPTTLTLL
jgi:hypothetical protein